MDGINGGPYWLVVCDGSNDADEFTRKGKSSLLTSLPLHMPKSSHGRHQSAAVHKNHGHHHFSEEQWKKIEVRPTDP